MESLLAEIEKQNVKEMEHLETFTLAFKLLMKIMQIAFGKAKTSINYWTTYAQDYLIWGDIPQYVAEYVEEAIIKVKQEFIKLYKSHEKTFHDYIEKDQIEEMQIITDRKILYEQTVVLTSELSNFSQNFFLNEIESNIQMEANESRRLDFESRALGDSDIDNDVELKKSDETMLEMSMFEGHLAGINECIRKQSINDKNLALIVIMERQILSTLDSLTPSTSPSNIPSNEPSSESSNEPSSESSNEPSDVSSTIPSTLPIDLPSVPPSTLPSDLPSHASSTIPSTVPSDLPSIPPSTLPSDLPSDPTLTSPSASAPSASAPSASAPSASPPSASAPSASTPSTS